MRNFFFLTAFDHFHQKYYSSRFFFYEEAERVARHLMENDSNVWAVKINTLLIFHLPFFEFLLPIR